MTAPSLLDVRAVGISFGGLKAAHGISLQLPHRALHGLIGPNGAGKTTFFNMLSGIYHPDEGQILLDGKNVVGMSAYQIALAGMTRTFQNIRLFGEMSVQDNVRLAAQAGLRSSFLSALLRTPRHYTHEREIARQSRELLELFGLADRADTPASGLSYGQQRHLEIARALATRPKVLLLDEPAAGLHSGEKCELAAMIVRIREQFDVAVLLIEHDMGLVMEICERITVLDHGQVTAEGSPEEIQQHPGVIAAYLGVVEDDVAKGS